MIRNLWRRLRDRFVQDVPASMSACEFDCRAVACRQGEWERCEHRLRHSTAGLPQWAARPGDATVRSGTGQDGRGA
jgi:hypothetical protein